MIGLSARRGTSKRSTKKKSSRLMEIKSPGLLKSSINSRLQTSSPVNYLQETTLVKSQFAAE